MSVQTVFFSKIKKTAIDGWRTHKILPSILAAQSILETGWGRSDLAMYANNYFGIKADSKWKGDTYVKVTNEYVSSKVRAKFRKYRTIEEGFMDYKDFLSKPLYKKVIGEKVYKKAAEELKAAGYATDPNYVSKICKLIEDYKLYLWDEEAFQLNNEITYRLSMYGEKDLDAFVKMIKLIQKDKKWLTYFDLNVTTGKFKDDKQLEEGIKYLKELGFTNIQKNPN